MFRSVLWRVGVCVVIPWMIVASSACVVVFAACSVQPCIKLSGSSEGKITKTKCYYYSSARAFVTLWANDTDGKSRSTTESLSTPYECPKGDCTSQCAANEYPAEGAVNDTSNCTGGAATKYYDTCISDS